MIRRHWRRFLRAVVPFSGRFAFAALCGFLAAACESATDPAAEFEAAQRAMNHWVERHPSGWTLNMSSDHFLTRPEWSRPCPEDPPGGFTALRHRAVATEIDIFFRCPVAANPTVADLTAAFSHIVLEELPHGIASRGWQFRVLTPVSSFSEGVTFSAAGTGRLLVKIDAPLFAVYGHSVRPECQPPADAPSPEGCYYLREHRIPLKLTLSVPFRGTELD